MAQGGPDAVEEAHEALRKLNRDLTSFRDPAVRRHLQFTSPLSPTTAPMSDNPAQLMATIIALRTELHEAAEARDSTRDELFTAKKRAAKAEAEGEELRKQMRDKHVEHEEILKGAAERIQSLEEETTQAAQSATNKALVLQETIERDRLGHAAIIAERNKFHAQSKQLQAKVDALQRDLRASEEGRRVDRRMVQRDSAAAQSKLSSLQDEVKFLTESLHDGTGTSEQLQSSRRHSMDLQRETALVRTKLAEQTKEAVRLREKLADMEQTVSNLRAQRASTIKDEEELSLLRKEVRMLRNLGKDSDTLRQQASALINEKEVLTDLISGLSLSGDIQDGLRILKDSSLRGKAIPDPESHVNHGLATYRQKLENMEARYKLEIERLRGEKEAAANRLAQAVVEKDDALSSINRNLRIRRILENQKNIFKDAVEQMDLELEVSMDSDTRANKWRQRCTKFEKLAIEYESLLKETEKSLAESQEKVQSLLSALASLKGVQQAEPMDSSEVTQLRDKLSEAMKTVKEAIDAREIAQQNASNALERAATVEAELQKLKLVTENGTANPMKAVELDYDPAVTKVLHIKDNLFSKAVEAAAIELEKAKGKKRMRIEAGQNISPSRDAPTDEKSITIASLVKQLEELEAENARVIKASKVGVRTGEVARKKIEEVRSAVYNLFGWSMKVIGAKYIVASIYAESPEDVLEFGVNEQGTMTLLETGYTMQLKDEIDQFVHKMKSIPALLSNITLDNFEKTTLA